MALEQEIKVVTVVDDSGLIESFENINEQMETTEESSKSLNQSLDNTFRPRETQGFSKSIDTSTTSLQKQEKQVKKNTRSLSRFNRGAGRGISALSRFTGAGGRATRSLAGVGLALGGTPFGAFAIAASAASVAYSLFADKLGFNNDEIIKKNKELRDSITELEAGLRSAFQEGKLLAIDLEDLSEAEKRLRKIAVFRENIGTEETALRELNAEQQRVENRLIDRSFESETERLELEKRVLELKKERQAVATTIANNEIKILQLEKEGEKAAEDRDKKRQQREKDTQALFESLIRDELDKRIIALENQAKKREENAKKTIRDQDLLNKFLRDSEQILGEDIAELRESFRDAELKARRELLTQLVSDEEAAAKAGVQSAFEERKKAIQNLDVSDDERANLVKKNEIKLQKELTDITTEFAQKREDERLKKESDLFELRLASTEARIQADQALFEEAQERERQEFALQARTEEEITEFNKQQNEEKLKNDLEYQIKRLELTRQFNKQLTQEEKDALDAQINNLKVQIQGVGTEIKKAKTEGGTLGDLLGISKEAQQNSKAIQGALEQATQAISAAVAERIRLLDEEINKRNENIDNLEGDLDREIRLAELGKAANVAQVQEQIAEEKAARDKAEAEKKEAAKTQFALDTALQASNLVTAISGLYSSLSGIGFGAGVAIATALSAVMIGAFIASKAQAAQVAGFAEGGYTGDGAKYQESTTLGAKPYKYHKGEYMIPADKVEEYGLEGVPIGDLDSALGSHFSDSSIPNYRGIGKANKRVNKSLEINAEKAHNDRMTAISLGFRGALGEQNKILKAQLNALLNMPEVVQTGERETTYKKGNTTHVFRW
jgi:hypothetical protein